MGKVVSKIVPTYSSAKALQAANSKVSRKVLYRRLQSPRSYYQRGMVGMFDFVAHYWGAGLYFFAAWIFYLRGDFDDMIANRATTAKLEKSLYESAKDFYVKQKNSFTGFKDDSSKEMKAP